MGCPAQFAPRIWVHLGRAFRNRVFRVGCPHKQTLGSSGSEVTTFEARALRRVENRGLLVFPRGFSDGAVLVAKVRLARS